MSHALSRRALLGAAVTSVAASGRQAPSGQPAPPEIETARRQQQDAYEQMRKTKLPIAVEPATVFKP